MVSARMMANKDHPSQRRSESPGCLMHMAVAVLALLAGDVLCTHQYCGDQLVDDSENIVCVLRFKGVLHLKQETQM
jgi:hypothetical protein